MSHVIQFNSIPEARLQILQIFMPNNFTINDTCDETVNYGPVLEVQYYTTEGLSEVRDHLIITDIITKVNKAIADFESGGKIDPQFEGITLRPITIGDAFMFAYANYNSTAEDPYEHEVRIYQVVNISKPNKDSSTNVQVRQIPDENFICAIDSEQEYMVVFHEKTRRYVRVREDMFLLFKMGHRADGMCNAYVDNTVIQCITSDLSTSPIITLSNY